MKDKYYTPEIEEFCVGFEFELREGVIWNKITSDIQIQYALHLPGRVLKDFIRVKYLDREDIESLGLEHIGAYWFESKKLNCRIRKWKELEIDIYKNWSDINLAEQDELRCFRGNIKNKSELKVILKQLNIK
mgnify:CR=1 FL=1